MVQNTHSQPSLEDLRPGPGPQLVSEKSTVVDVPAELARIRESTDWNQGAGRLSKMLIKHSGLRVALIAMKAGNQWAEHTTPSRIAVQPVSGSIRFQLPDREVTLRVGELLVVDSAVPHSVEALEDAAFLLTLS
jgi:quercetin dioxygenase-like cupin family protein